MFCSLNNLFHHCINPGTGVDPPPLPSLLIHVHTFCLSICLLRQKVFVFMINSLVVLSTLISCDKSNLEGKKKSHRGNYMRDETRLENWEDKHFLQPQKYFRLVFSLHERSLVQSHWRVPRKNIIPFWASHQPNW